jgi:hypothetical protein
MASSASPGRTRPLIRRREDVLERVELVDGEARAGAALQGGRRGGRLDVLGGAAEALWDAATHRKAVLFERL